MRVSKKVGSSAAWATLTEQAEAKTMQQKSAFEPVICGPLSLVKGRFSTTRVYQPGSGPAYLTHSVGVEHRRIVAKSATRRPPRPLALPRCIAALSRGMQDMTPPLNISFSTPETRVFCGPITILVALPSKNLGSERGRMGAVWANSNPAAYWSA